MIEEALRSLVGNFYFPVSGEFGSQYGGFKILWILAYQHAHHHHHHYHYHQSHLCHQHPINTISSISTTVITNKEHSQHQHYVYPHPAITSRATGTGSATIIFKTETPSSVPRRS